MVTGFKSFLTGDRIRRRLRKRVINHLHLASRNTPDYTAGIVDAVELLNDAGFRNSNGYRIGDMLLLKLNMIASKPTKDG